MTTLVSELRDELVHLDEAITEYGRSRTQEACELICIRSRVALATFEELACWTQAVDAALQGELVAILSRAVTLLDKDVGPSDPGFRYFLRIRQRRDRAAEFKLAMLDDRLPPSS